MQFGVNILNFGPGARPDALLRWAQVSEALGYHSIMISDHVAVTPGVSDRYPEPFYDCFASLSWLAGQTKTIKLGTTVNVLPYRHPVLMARLVANVDQFSGGRFIYGVGLGNVVQEFDVLGTPHPKRGAVANESLRVMLALWNSPEPVTLDGHYFAIKEVSGIETAQKPHPPIWVGGGSEGALKRTVRYGQAWHPIFRSPDQLDQAEKVDLPRLKELATEQGGLVPAFCPRIRLDLHDEAIEDADRLLGSGSLEQIRGDLKRLQGLGAEHVTLDWNTGNLDATRNHEHGLAMISVMAAKVLDLEHESLR